MNNQPGPSSKPDFCLELNLEPDRRQRQSSNSDSDGELPEERVMKAHYEEFNKILKEFIENTNSDPALVSKYRIFVDESFEEIFGEFSTYENKKLLSIYKYFLLHIRSSKKNKNGEYSIVKPSTLDVYHKQCRSIFKKQNIQFFNFLNTSDALDEIKEMKQEHEVNYRKANPAREEKKVIFEIQQGDLRKIFQLGKYAETEYELLSCLAYFWTILFNFDRPAEKLRFTQLQDLKFENWREVHFTFRDPSAIAQKVKNAKTKRSFGILVYIPSGPTFQPYNILWLYVDLLLKAGKKPDGPAWWLPGPVNEEYKETMSPYTNGDQMMERNATDLFKTLGKYLKKYGFPPFEHEYTTGTIRKSGINISTLLNFTKEEITFVSGHELGQTNNRMRTHYLDPLMMRRTELNLNWLLYIEPTLSIDPYLINLIWPTSTRLSGYIMRAHPRLVPEMNTMPAELMPPPNAPQADPMSEDEIAPLKTEYPAIMNTPMSEDEI